MWLSWGQDSCSKNDNFNISHNSLSAWDETAQQKSIIPYLRISRFRIICEIVAHPELLPQGLVVSWHIHLTWVSTKTLRWLTLWFRMQSRHDFLIPVDWINMVLINANYNEKNITNALVRAFKQLIQWIVRFQKNEKGEITWWRSWRWPSLRGHTPSINLSSTSIRLFASGLVMFPSPGCLTPSL
jgi:hypothetical protein